MESLRLEMVFKVIKSNHQLKHLHHVSCVFSGAGVDGSEVNQRPAAERFSKRDERAARCGGQDIIDLVTCQGCPCRELGRRKCPGFVSQLLHQQQHFPHCPSEIFAIVPYSWSIDGAKIPEQALWCGKNLGYKGFLWRVGSFLLPKAAVLLHHCYGDRHSAGDKGFSVSPTWDSAHEMSVRERGGIHGIAWFS